MAKLEVKLKGNFGQVLKDISDAVLSKSVSAKLEESSNFSIGNSRCAIRVFERYSYLGQNRVSMNVTLFQKNEELLLSAISSGGSQAVFFKFNSFGEKAFLDTLQPALNKYQPTEI